MNGKIKIFEKGEKVLREKAEEVPVQEIKKEKFRKIIQKMERVITENEEAVAVAAPQIGEGWRIFAISEWAKNSETRKEKKEFKNIIFINPKIIKTSQRQKSMPEGCLSTPFLFGTTKRAEKIRVEALDENGKKFTHSASGLFAQALQHEIDHLNGILFVDKATNLSKIEKQEEKTNKMNKDYQNIDSPKIIFFGTPEFSVKILEYLKEAKMVPVLIVTSPDKPKGRKMRLAPPPVKIWAEENGVEYIQPETLKNNSDIYPLLSSLLPDIIIATAYGKFLPKEIIKIPKYGALNIHPSLLPQLRGPSPIQYAILTGDKTTGVTIILMNEKMDEGQILTNHELQITNNATYKELEKKLAEVGGKLLVETIPKWLAGEIQPSPQNHSKATYSKILTKKDGLIDFSEPAEIIEKKIRAFTPWPGAYVFVNGKRVIITESELDKNNALKIKRVKPEGKKEMDFKDYIKSNPKSLSILSHT
ncbi:MAG: methionyl-tRNA formyltransferase [bacterium]|nr:methionyl-tRNA formyltransferase [bacterium]